MSVYVYMCEPSNAWLVCELVQNLPDNRHALLLCRSQRIRLAIINYNVKKDSDDLTESVTKKCVGMWPKRMHGLQMRTLTWGGTFAGPWLFVCGAPGTWARSPAQTAARTPSSAQSCRGKCRLHKQDQIVDGCVSRPCTAHSGLVQHTDPAQPDLLILRWV